MNVYLGQNICLCNTTNIPNPIIYIYIDVTTPFLVFDSNMLYKVIKPEIMDCLCDLNEEGSKEV